MFVFKLQTVLDYRKNFEEKILNEFSENKRELEGEELKLQRLMEEREKALGELRNMQNKPLHVDDIAGYVSYIEQVRKSEETQNKVIAQVQEKLEAKRAELLEAVKKRKIMEKLRERHAEEYAGAMRALEQKNSDEMSVLKYGRRDR